MKTKRLLSIALVASMLFSLLNIGTFANEVKTGKLSIKSPETITVGTETVDVDFTLTFDEETKSPHSLCTIVTDLELTALAVKTVDGVEPPVYNGTEEEPDDGLVFADTVVISNDGADLANKKVIFESGTDSNAPEVTEIVFTATFNTADKAEGTYTVSATVDATNYDENDFNITVGENAVVTIAPAVVHEADTSKWITDANNHWHACTVENCQEHINYDIAPHDWNDGVVTKEAEVGIAGVMTYTCLTCEYEKTEEIPALEEPEEPVVGEIPVTWNPSQYAKYSDIVSLKNYSYQISYLIDKTYYDSVKSLENAKLQMVVTGTDLEFTKNISWYQANTLYFGQCSIGRLNADLNWQLVITYTDSNGVEHIDYTSTHTSNFMERLTELYNKGTYTGDELALVEEFFAFNDVWKNASFSNLPLTNYTASDYGANETQWNISTYKNYIYTNFSNFHQQVVYKLPTSLYNTLNSNKDTLTLKMIISGDTTNFSKDINLSQANWLFFRNVSLKKMMEDLTWKLTYEYVDSNGMTQTGETNGITVNIANELASSSDPVAVAFTEYVAAWNIVYGG